MAGFPGDRKSLVLNGMTSVMKSVMVEGEDPKIRHVDSAKVRTGSSATYLSSAFESQSSLLSPSIEFILYCVASANVSSDVSPDSPQVLPNRNPCQRSADKSCCGINDHRRNFQVTEEADLVGCCQAIFFHPTYVDLHSIILQHCPTSR